MLSSLSLPLGCVFAPQTTRAPFFIYFFSPAAARPNFFSFSPATRFVLPQRAAAGTARSSQDGDDAGSIRIDRLKTTPKASDGAVPPGRNRTIRRTNSLLGFSSLDRDATDEQMEEANRRASSKAEEEKAHAEAEVLAMQISNQREKAKAQRRVNSVRRRSLSSETLNVVPPAQPAADAPRASSQSQSQSQSHSIDPAVRLRPKSASTGDVEEFTLTLRKTDGGGLGLSIKEMEAGASGVAVNNLKPGQAAQMAGVLKDDFLLSVDGIDTTCVTKAEALAILKATGSETVRPLFVFFPSSFPHTVAHIVPSLRAPLASPPGKRNRGYMIHAR
jgi:hypothetical protein